MTIFIRHSPPSPFWQYRFKLPKQPKAERGSTNIKVELGNLTLEQADGLRLAGKMKGALLKSYNEALAVEAQAREGKVARIAGKFTKATLQVATQDYFDNVLSVSKAIQKAQARGVNDITTLPVVRNYFSAVRRIHAGLGKDTVLDDLTDDHVLDWRNKMKKGGKRVAVKGGTKDQKSELRGEGLSIGSCNANLRVLSTVLTTAHEAKKMQRVPAIPFYEEDEGEPKCLDKDEVALVMDGARAYSQRIERVVAFAFNIGSRKTEMFLTPWKHVDFEASKVFFPAANTKTGKGRRVPMTAQVRTMLQTMKAEQEAVGRGQPNDRVFGYTHTNGLWYEPSNIDDAVASIQKAIDMPDFTLHVCRHTFASMLLRRGARLIEVSKLLGHKDLETTQIYAHLEQDNLDQAVTLLDAGYAAAD